MLQSCFLRFVCCCYSVFLLFSKKKEFKSVYNLIQLCEVFLPLFFFIREIEKREKIEPQSQNNIFLLHRSMNDSNKISWICDLIFHINRVLFLFFRVFFSASGHVMVLSMSNANVNTKHIFRLEKTVFFFIRKAKISDNSFPIFIIQMVVFFSTTQWFIS